MPLTIREWPAHDRPRERLERQGAHALSPRELLAILIETGVPASAGKPARSALDLAGDLLEHFASEPGGLRRMAGAPLAVLCEVPGIGPAKATKVVKTAKAPASDAPGKAAVKKAPAKKAAKKATAKRASAKKAAAKKAGAAKKSAG